MQKNKIGLICGRFNPLHLGHTFLINKALLITKKLYILIGSSQEEKTLKNPYSYQNRLSFFKSIYGEKIKKGIIKIQPIEDINDPPNWVSHVLQHIPDKVDIYFAGSPLDSDLFQNKIPIVCNINRENNDFKSATYIRHLIQEGDTSWVNLVPEKVVKIIKGLGE